MYPNNSLGRLVILGDNALILGDPALELDLGEPPNLGDLRLDLDDVRLPLDLGDLRLGNTIYFIQLFLFYKLSHLGFFKSQLHSINIYTALACIIREFSDQGLPLIRRYTQLL